MRSILAVAFVLVSVGVYAQTGRGSFVVGGSLNFQRISTDVNNHTSYTISPQTPAVIFSINPTIGYFPVKNLMTGLLLNYSHRQSPQGNYKYNQFGVGPVVRYYFPFGKFAVFPEIGATFSKSRTLYNFTATDGTVVTLDSRHSTNVYRGGAGIAWFVRPNIGIEAIVAYRLSDQKPDPLEIKQSDIYFNIGLQFYIPGRGRN